MGLFSLFSSRSPEDVARRIAAKSIQVELSPGEDALATDLGIEVARLVSERILLKVGIAEATIAHIAFETKRHEAVDVLRALKAIHREHFVSRPGIVQEVGARIYERAISRYIMMQPQEVAARFEEQLRDSSKWDEPPSEPNASASIRVFDYVDTHMKDVARFAFDVTVEHVRSLS